MANLAHFVSYRPDANARFHLLHAYLPPTPDNRSADRFDFLERRDYFKTNPEWYSYRQRNRDRVPQRTQLCFASPEMRAELTRNIRKVADRSPEHTILSVGAEDHGGRLCECPGCMGLEAKYQTPAGPILDYLFELCETLARTHPTLKVRTPAYRRDQTQRPPVLPEGQKLPENLIIWFAPIHDNYFADWNHPDPEIQRTYADLVRWNELAAEVHMFLYLGGYGSGSRLPVGMVRRFVTNLRLAHQAGATGIYNNDPGTHTRTGFSELLHYLQVSLSRDINQDEDVLIAEFTDNLYGAAAPLIRRYLDELEQERLAMTELPDGVTYRSANRDLQTFPYLTAENIHRWQTYFERMSELTADASERVRNNVLLARRELDVATLWQWIALREYAPDVYTNPAEVAGRIEAANATEPRPRTADTHPAGNRTAWEIETGKGMNRRWSTHMRGMPPLVRELLTRIEAGGEEKPLPDIFDGIDPRRIRTFLPTYPNNRPGQAVIPDPWAPFGFAVPVENPDLPFQFGFFDRETRTHGPRRRLELDEIKPGEYQTFKLGRVEITQDCLLWFSAASWATSARDLGDHLWEPGEETYWDAYVTLRFDGPTYGSEPDEDLLPVARRQSYERRHDHTEDLVLVGRVILVHAAEE